ncbi:MAG: bifunctional heptose 7-phosphate kinase/heptose 1-phosphate adenyltransferase [Planctomycetes bacterium]|nr:bifunctional heptose 7-phosphate kinase/heptose 1-phosphate adenyltransferase [Planctomycetota bacterium]
MQNHLLEVSENLGNPRICVVGDLMLDTYVWGRVSRVSPEGPIPILHVDRKEHRPGGAGSVASMLCALECSVSCVGVIGQDPAAKELRRELQAAGADTTGLIPSADRPTILKTRYLGYVQSAGRGLQQIVRVDEEITDPIPPEIADKVLKQVKTSLDGSDLLLIQDMAKGLFTPSLLQKLIQTARKASKRVIVDPECSEDYSGYHSADYLLPNRLETEAATKTQLDNVDSYREAARQLLKDLDLENVIITLDREGMFYATAEGTERHVATKPRSVLDVTGAGDMVAAMISLAIAEQTPLDNAVALANAAAGMEVSRQGASPISRAEMIADLRSESSPGLRKIKTRDELQNILDEGRKQGKSVAFTNGVFDLLHLGHMELIRFAGQQADELVVAVNSDRSVRELKGPSRPINSEDARARTLASLPHVDYVVIFEERSVLPLIKQLRPDVLVKGGDYDKAGVVGYEFVESYGGQVKLAPKVEGLSTTELIRRITENNEGND